MSWIFIVGIIIYIISQASNIKLDSEKTNSNGQNWAERKRKLEDNLRQKMEDLSKNEEVDSLIGVLSRNYLSNKKDEKTAGDTQSLRKTAKQIADERFNRHDHRGQAKAGGADPMKDSRDYMRSETQESIQLRIENRKRVARQNQEFKDFIRKQHEMQHQMYKETSNVNR